MARAPIAGAIGSPARAMGYRRGMAFTPRVLDPEPVASLDAYVSAGGGRGLERARELGGDAVLAEIEASGLRGRGGAGFPTGTKWRTVLENLPPGAVPTVVVNAAEGEPGTFKDRAIIRANPYRVIEGALIAARTIGADSVVVATKESFETEAARLLAAIDEVTAAGWADGVKLDLVRGPSEYLYGEETGLLSVLAGGPPLPRVTPPFRAGAGAEHQPTLINNVETLANVPAFGAGGGGWSRARGPDESPGTLVVTVSGRTRRHGVAEVEMGTSTADAITAIGGGGLGPIVAVVCGASNPPLPGDRLDTPLSYEGWSAAGTSLGSASLIVLDDGVDAIAVAQGISRFLAVESCGQCTPCKADGLAIASILDRLRQSEPEAGDLDDLSDRLRTVSTEARCALAGQHETVVGGILALFPDAAPAHAEARVLGAEPFQFAPVVELEGDIFRLDEAHLGKQPDWTYDEVDSGTWPAARFADPDAERAEEA
jgi:NADH:ubiquinone oxidoreductase subunit F (NADH-binding)